MKSFQYVIQDPVGIHARPAGLLSAKAKEFNAVVKIAAGGRKSEVTKLMAVMAMGITCGQEITIIAEGPDEEEAIAELEKFVRENL